MCESVVCEDAVCDSVVRGCHECVLCHVRWLQSTPLCHSSELDGGGASLQLTHTPPLHPE